MKLRALVAVASSLAAVGTIGMLPASSANAHFSHSTGRVPSSTFGAKPTQTSEVLDVVFEVITTHGPGSTDNVGDHASVSAAQLAALDK